MLPTGQPTIARLWNADMKSHREGQRSNTWIVFTTLVIVFFYFQVNVIYSVITTGKCDLFSTYWATVSDAGITIYGTTFLAFTLIGLWALIELTLGALGLVADRFAAIFVNCFIVASAVFCLFALEAQWSAFEVEWSRVQYDEIIRRPHVTDDEYYWAFSQFLTSEVCAGNIGPYVPSSMQEHEDLYEQFLESDFIRAN